MNAENGQSPHENFKQGMKNIGQANKQAAGQDDEDIDVDKATTDTEKILDNMESKDIDKNMGQTKVPVAPYSMSQKEYGDLKEASDAAKSLRALANAQKEHLSPEEIKTMHLMTAEFETQKITDTYLLDLLHEKVDFGKEYKKGTLAIKELQRKLLSELSSRTNDLIKTKGAMEGIDRLLLKRYMKLKSKED